MVWRAGDTAVHVQDVNSSGLMVGDVSRAGVTIDRTGTTTPLPKNPAWDSYAADKINDVGDIAGTATIGQTWKVIVWPAGSPGTYRELTTPALGTGPMIKGLDEQGRVVAIGDTAHGGYVWDTDRIPRKLKAFFAQGYGWGSDIRDGRVVGSTGSQTSWRGAEWDSRGNLVGTTNVDLKAIGGQGTIAGETDRPVLWRNGQIVDKLTGVPSGLQVTGISDDEQVVVGGTYGDFRAAQYRCS